MHDAVILGGGLAGSAMATALAGLGWNTVILDRGDYPRHKACGEFLSPEAKGSFKRLGLDHLVESLAPARITNVKLTAVSGASVRFNLQEAGMGLSRYSLDHALINMAKAKGVMVGTRTSVTAVYPTRDGYRIEMTNGQGRKTLHSRAVIGAWGRQRPVLLSGNKPLRNARACVGAGLQLEGVDLDGAVEMYFVPGGYVGLGPVEAGITNAAAVLDRRFKGWRKEEWLSHATASNRSLAARLSDARPIPDTFCAASPVQADRSPESWGLVPQIGDAALVVPPLCGDGMAMALRAIELILPLADGYLRGQLTLAKWRESYDRLLRAELLPPAKRARLLQAALLRPALAEILLRAGALMPYVALRVFQATRLPLVPANR